MVRRDIYWVLIVTVLILCITACKKNEQAERGKDKLYARGVPAMPKEAKSVDDFGTGLDLRSITYWRELSLPEGIALVKDDNLGDIRAVYMKSTKNGEGILLELKANGARTLSVGKLGSWNDGPKLKAVIPSLFSTSLGIAPGASVDEVTSKYGKPRIRTHPIEPDAQYLDYKASPGDSFISLLTFVFDKGVLITISETYYNPKLALKWGKAKHDYNFENGRFFPDESERSTYDK